MELTIEHIAEATQRELAKQKLSYRIIKWIKKLFRHK